MLEESENNSYLDEWKFAALVFDRLCFYVFTATMVIALFGTIGTMPGWYELGDHE